MDPERLAVVQGWTDTRDTMRAWSADLGSAIRPWFAVSLLVALMLLTTTWLLATFLVGTDHAPYATFSGIPTVHDAATILARNLLVLALHALVCVAGYMAMASVPIAAEAYTGWAHRLHRLAPPFALGFVWCATLGSLTTQALALGYTAPSVARAYDLPVWELLLLLTPHALPELTALFLPLGAWLVLARRGAWNSLLAASLLSTVIALPMLVIAAMTEEYVTPLVLAAVA